MTIKRPSIPAIPSSISDERVRSFLSAIKKNIELDNGFAGVDSKKLTVEELVAAGFYSLLDVEPWHDVGSGGDEPPLENGWVNYGAPSAVAAFYKDPWDWVHIKGLVKSGTVGTAVFTLPAGYRPSEYLYFVQPSNNAYGDMYIHSNGAVIPITGSNVWFSINCSFRA